MNYRSSPLPICQSPICSNPLHYQRQLQSLCNYSQSHQQNCYPQQPSTQPTCTNYQISSPSPYNQCPSSRSNYSNSQYCPSPNYASQPNGGQILSPVAGQVMSPGSHYAPSHISDQPLTSPAAGALAPQHAPQNLPQNSAQLTRNCPQNHMHHGYYPGYGCQGQLGGNCTGTFNGQNHHANSTCASSNHGAMTPQQCVPMRPVVNCPQMSPHCTQAHVLPNQPTLSHPNLQCGQTASQCTRTVMTPNGQAPTLHCGQQTSVPNQCPQMSPHCPQLSMSNLAKPVANTSGLQGCQQQSQQQPTSPCFQTGHCSHLNSGHRPVTDNNLPKRVSPQFCTAQQTNCRMQLQQHTCTHSCQARPNPPNHQQYNCSCLWSYGGDQCYHEQSGASIPEIQCRDISQSQQRSPMKPPPGLRQDSYRRTLEYVQQCRNWTGQGQTHETNVSSSTHPMSLPQPLPSSANMVVNDMTSSISSLLEENRYLQMIQ